MKMAALVICSRDACRRRAAFRAALGAAVASASCAAAMADRAPIETPDGVRFTFANAAAKSVSVAGNFNEWSATANPLARSGKVWTAVVTLPPGEHLFMFIVDGKWVVPPLAEDSRTMGLDREMEW